MTDVARTADEELLASLGYKQEFRREFTGLEVSIYPQCPLCESTVCGFAASALRVMRWWWFGAAETSVPNVGPGALGRISPL